MDRELQRYYEDSFSMFSSRGWLDFVEDMQRLKDSINNIASCQSDKDLWFRKGQLDILDLLLTRKQTCEQAFKALQDEENL